MSYIEIDREVDGRWIAEIPSVPGAMAYGTTADEAATRAVWIAEMPRLRANVRAAVLAEIAEIVQ
jgi:predicted RNase H-like HicB family nuclease